MAEINAQLVKRLREMTDAPMMDCKKALVETDGDIDKAAARLREKGLSKAAKKADRIAAEGVISVKVTPDLSRATMLEINSETDFVAKNDGFRELVAKTSDLVQNSSVTSPQDLNALTLEGASYEEYLKTRIAKIGENIVVRRIANLKAGSNGIVTGYVHSNGRVGVLIAIECNEGKNAQSCAELIRNLCMHAAAMKPSVVDSSGFDEDYVRREKIALTAEIEKENEELKRLGKPLRHVPEYVSRVELTPDVLKAKENAFREELKKQGKPEAIWDKIIPGQMERYVADNTLLDQRMTLLGQFFVMDDKKTVEQVLEQKSREIGDDIRITEYVRFELGEGIEKKAGDFAAEVAAQMK